MTVTEIVVQTQPSFVEWIAATATAASAGVIAWQAWQTRRSVQASEDAVQIAQAALTESQLARIESGVPRLTVTTPMIPEAEKLWRRDGFQRVMIAEDEIFKLPRDADLILGFEHTFTVRNDGPGTVLPLTRASESVSVQGFAEPIPPNSERVFTFAVRRTVAEWVTLLKPEVAISTKEVDGESERTVHPVCASVDVVYSGPRDSDVDEIHTVSLRGSALVAVSDAQGDWRRYSDFEWDGTLRARVAPAIRNYWRSRSAGVRFDTHADIAGTVLASKPLSSRKRAPKARTNPGRG